MNFFITNEALVNLHLSETLLQHIFLFVIFRFSHGQCFDVKNILQEILNPLIMRFLYHTYIKQQKKNEKINDQGFKYQKLWRWTYKDPLPSNFRTNTKFEVLTVNKSAESSKRLSCRTKFFIDLFYFSSFQAIKYHWVSNTQWLRRCVCDAASLIIYFMAHELLTLSCSNALRFIAL